MQYIYRHNKLQKEYHNLVGVAAGASLRHHDRPTILRDSEDGLSSEDNCSDSGSEGAFASWRSAAHVAHEVERYELLSQCNLTVSFARNFSLERRDLPNTAIDVHVSNVDVKVRSLWKYYAKKAVRQQELGEEG